MKRDVVIDKRLLRVKPDEIYPQIVRDRSGKLITLRKFVLIYKPFPSRSHYFVYYKDNKPLTTGEINKSELFTAMRKLSIEI